MKTSKPPVLTPPAQEQEARRSSTRARRSKGEIAKEEAYVGEEEEEEIEEKELPVEKDEEETPKRRRSARSSTTHQKKSSKVKRSPSPPELSETISKSTSADSEEMAEERVPPLLSLEGFQHRVSEKQMTTAAEKAVTPQFIHKASSKSHRSPQKGGRHVRGRREGSSDPSAQEPPATTRVIKQTPNRGHETGKDKYKILDTHVTEETLSSPKTRGSTTKDVKVKSSLVLIKPPIRSKSDGKAYVREQSLHIVEKSSSRGVQAMSILEKQEPKSYENKESTITLSSCPDVGRSNVKTMSILGNVGKDKLDANLAMCGGDAFESDKAEVVSSVYGSSLSKRRKLRIRSSSANRTQQETNILPTVKHPDIQEAHKTKVLSVSLNVKQTTVPTVTTSKKPKLQACGQKQKKETNLLSIQDKGHVLPVRVEEFEKSDLKTTFGSDLDIRHGGITTSTNRFLVKEISCSGSLEIPQSSLNNQSSKKEPILLNEISELKQEVQPSAEDFNTSKITMQLEESMKLEKPDKTALQTLPEDIPLKPFAEISVLESEATTGKCESSVILTEILEDQETERASALIAESYGESQNVYETMKPHPDLQEMSNVMIYEDVPQITLQHVTNTITEPTFSDQSFPSSSAGYSNVSSEFDTQVDYVKGVQIMHEAEIKIQAPLEASEEANSNGDEIKAKLAQEFCTATPVNREDVTKAELHTEVKLCPEAKVCV